jgi:hypothetical protein
MCTVNPISAYILDVINTRSSSDRVEASVAEAGAVCMLESEAFAEPLRREANTRTVIAVVMIEMAFKVGSSRFKIEPTMPFTVTPCIVCYVQIGTQ